MADISVTTASTPLAAYNGSRTRLIVQNLSTTVVFVNVLGTSGNPATTEGLALPQYGTITLDGPDASRAVAAATAADSATVRVIGV